MSNEVINAEIVESKSRELSVKEVDDKLAWLSESELYALEYFRKTYQKGGANTFPLAPSLQEQLFRLYLNGKSLSEIRALNKHLMFGQIVDAAVAGDWNHQRQEYLSTIAERSRIRLQQIACESLDFLADQMSAAHKQHGEAAQRYLQTGNPDDLGSFGIGSLRQYKEAAELLLKLTGQDKNSTVNVTGQINHIASSEVSGQSTGKTLAQLAAEKKSKE
jgi:hypothetical protein